MRSLAQIAFFILASFLMWCVPPPEAQCPVMPLGLHRGTCCAEREGQQAPPSHAAGACLGAQCVLGRRGFALRPVLLLLGACDARECGRGDEEDECHDL